MHINNKWRKKSENGWYTYPVEQSPQTAHQFQASKLLCLNYPSSWNNLRSVLRLHLKICYKRKVELHTECLSSYQCLHLQAFFDSLRQQSILVCCKSGGRFLTWWYNTIKPNISTKKFHLSDTICKWLNLIILLILPKMLNLWNEKRFLWLLIRQIK